MVECGFDFLTYVWIWGLTLLPLVEWGWGGVGWHSYIWLNVGNDHSYIWLNVGFDISYGWMWGMTFLHMVECGVWHSYIWLNVGNDILKYDKKGCMGQNKMVENNWIEEIRGLRIDYRLRPSESNYRQFFMHFSLLLNVILLSDTLTSAAFATLPYLDLWPSQE